LIARARQGDAAAESDLIDALDPELRRLARHYVVADRCAHTPQTTELLHEAWLRLFGSAGVSIQDRNHLVALTATHLRRILVDCARQRNVTSGAGDDRRVSLTALDGGGSQQDDDVLAIDEALTALEAVDARASKVVEMRFFAGLTEAEAAQTLGIPVAAIERDWSFARAWLHDRLTAKHEPWRAPLTSREADALQPSARSAPSNPAWRPGPWRPWQSDCS
jgi:RNA polymerase sigma factor (TIGR02999 family)